MSFFQAILLGLIQGVSEFLPISSSGHLEIFQHLFNLKTDQLTFDVFLHLSSLFAIFIFFYKKIIKISLQELKLVVIGTIPAVFFGVLYKLVLDNFSIPIKMIGLFLLITGIINFFSDKQLNNNDDQKILISDLSWKQALKIGFFQALAVLPGISRSGSTLLGGVLNNLDRRSAFQFSFFLAIPAILGAGAITSLELFESGLGQINVINFLSGGLAAFLSSILSLKLFSYIINKARLDVFAFYCLIVGSLVIFFLS